MCSIVACFGTAAKEQSFNVGLGGGKWQSNLNRLNSKSSLLRADKQAYIYEKRIRVVEIMWYDELAMLKEDQDDFGVAQP